MTEPGPRPLDAPGVALMVGCCALWGANAVAIKFATPDLPPIGVAGFRFLFALPVVAMACRWFGQPLWPSPRLGLLLAMHTGLTVAQIGAFHWGTSHSQAGRASIFINVHPLVVAPLSWILLGERMGFRGMTGLASAAIGVAIVLSGAPRGVTSAGDLAVLGSGMIFGAQTIAQKLTFGKIPPATLLFAQSVGAIPIFFAYSFCVEGTDAYHFTSRALGGVMFQGIAVSGVCFSTWMILLRRYPAGKLATLAFLTPIFGVGLGTLLRGEALTGPLVAGGGLVGIGIYLVAADKVGARAAEVAEAQRR